MKFFEEYKKQILIILAFILAVSALITMGRKSKSTFVENTLGLVITPLQDITSAVGGWFGDRISSLRDENDIYAENEELKARIELLEAENKRLLI